jgi:cobalt/nickel transport system permease protein
MAHIPDGVLSAPVLMGGAALAAVGVAAGLRALDETRLPAAALLSAAFFALSLVMIPLGPTSVHLLLSALALQVAMFGVGGITTLGVNTLIIAGPGWIAGALARPAVLRGPSGRAAAAGTLAGGGAVLLTTAAVAAALALSDPAYRGAAAVVGLANLPLTVAEAAVTGFAVGFLRRVRPETFAAAPGWRAA